MPYQVPALPELTAIIRELRDAYKNSNALRLSCISLLEKIAAGIESAPEQDRRDILLGGLIFVMTDIAKEYSWLSPERSTLYKTIAAKLNLSEQNLLNDDQRFMYLGRFYLHLAKNETTVDISGSYWKSKAALLSYVENDIKLLKKREEERLEALQAAQPTLNAVEKEIDQFCEAYLAEYNNRRFFRSESRVQLVNFIKFIRQTCRDQFSDEKVLESEDLYLKSCYIRLGLIMYVLLAINEEYGFFKPEGNRYLGKYNGSSLFKMCEKALNINGLSDLTCDQKMAWLNVLYAHVLEVSSKTEQYGNNPLFRDMAVHKEKLRHLCTHKSELHNQPGWGMWAVTSATSNVVSYSVGAAATQMVSAAVVETAAMGTLTTAAATVGLATGPAGWLMFGAGAIIMTQLARTALPAAGGLAFAYLQDWVATATSNATRHVIRRTFSRNRPEGFWELDKHPRLPSEEREFIEKWMRTTLALPDSIIDAKEKAHIRDILGIVGENDQEFVAHSDMATVFLPRK